MNKKISRRCQLDFQTFSVQLLQDLFDYTKLAVKVSPFNNKTYKSIMYDESQILDWLKHYSLYCFNERAFHLAMQPSKGEGNSVVIGVYDIRVGKLHLLLLEPLNELAVKRLPERLMAIVTYVAIYFLTKYPESVGVYFFDPPKPFLSNHAIYGYKVLTKGSDTPVLFATFDTLFERQKDFLFEVLLDKELKLDLRRARNTTSKR
ncbi:hypothetical protein L1D54_23590 [Vibrio brasiliensis]|jgi:hypothetical protein|uniref:hypothetical protein n=1 Tax=Vibrio brasiliensis TaxID=170652 RepID=UPI001EFE1910|nr:hypothetical protein [Vibrio brasiliensis]MCG9753425.1 hypothetical protein [Vibrio brasiliensis]MCG9783891.1 hypothetical protein [Vibrio brasiliensis]